MSFNYWVYVDSNPVNYFDPTGHSILESEADRADGIVNDLKRYGVNIKVDWGYNIYWYNNPVDSSKSGIQCDWVFGKWWLNELYDVKEAVLRLNSFMNLHLRSKIGEAYVVKVDNTCGLGCTKGSTIELRDNFGQWTVVHELGHVWDQQDGWKLSRDLETETGGYTSGSPWYSSTYCLANDPYHELPGCNTAGYFYGGIPPVTSGKGFNRREDFAESVAAYVFPDQAWDAMSNQLAWYKSRLSPDIYQVYEAYLYYDNFRSTPRGRYIANLMRQ